MDPSSKIYIAGHTGLVGSALLRLLQSRGYTNLLLRTHRDLDLTDQYTTRSFFDHERPEYVFMAAAKVGGILANSTQKADFLYSNLQVQTNIIDASYRSGVKKLLFLGSSCVYPKNAPQPMKEEYFMTGPVEESNDAYAIAKIAGVYMCQGYNSQYHTNFVSVMPTNVYGVNDNFNLSDSHVIPAMIRQLHEAKIHSVPSVSFWGTGEAKREFMYIDDLADACLFVMDHHDGSQIVNIGTGEDITLRDLSSLIQSIVGYSGTILWDSSKPTGVLRKQLDVTLLHSLGWRHTMDLRKGIETTYQWYLTNLSSARR